MKMIDDVIIIGIDSGYGNIKTANCCFPASVSTYLRRCNACWLRDRKPGIKKRSRQNRLLRLAEG